MADSLPKIDTSRRRPVRPKHPAPNHPVSKRAVEPMGAWTRFNLLVGGVLTPAFCHQCSFLLNPDPELFPMWQSGKLSDKLTFILQPTAGYVLYPMLLFSIVALLLFLLDEQRYGKRFWVRLGIFSGIPIALGYCVIFAISVLRAQPAYIPLATAVPMFLALMIWGPVAGTLAMLKRTAKDAKQTQDSAGDAGAPVDAKCPEDRSDLALIISVGALWAGATVIVAGGAMSLPFAVISIFLVPLLCGSAWMLLAYIAVSLRLVLHHPEARRFSPMQAIMLMTWLATFIALCRASVLLSIEAYLKLPTERPSSDCYVATAAARGHQRLVGSQNIGSQQNTAADFPANQQLRILKAFEICLWTLFPTSHRHLRRVYDRIGPTVARKIHSPLLADAMFCSLKPAEWLARIVLLAILKDQRTLVDKLYR